LLTDLGYGAIELEYNAIGPNDLGHAIELEYTAIGPNDLGHDWLKRIARKRGGSIGKLGESRMR
jgi:hypothetical protein